MTAVDWLTRRGLPMVFVDQEPTEGVTSVNVDDRGGARAAAQHLVDLGHRRVAIMTAALGGTAGVRRRPASPTPRQSKYVSRERLLGYLDVLDRGRHHPASCTGRCTATTRRRTSPRSTCSPRATGPPACCASPT